MLYGNESIGSVSPPSAQPSEILDYVSIVCVEEFSTEIHIHLDELMNSELLLFRIAKLYGYPIKFLLHQNCLQEVAFGLVKGYFWGDKRWHFAYCTHNVILNQFEPIQGIG